MSGDDIGQLAYLVLLGTVVLGWFIVQNRNGLSKSLQHAAVWGLLFIGVIAGAGLWGDIRREVLPRQAVISEGVIEVPRAPDGHYYLTLDLNDTPVRFVVDTGASDIVLSQADAKRIGLDPANLVYFGRARTANGEVQIAAVTLDEVRLGGIVDRGVTASVNGGEMDSSLLGMRYLSRFDRLEISDGRLVLAR